MINVHLGCASRKTRTAAGRCRAGVARLVIACLVASARAQDRAKSNARVPPWSSRVACWNVRARILPSNLTFVETPDAPGVIASVREVVTGAALPAQQISSFPAAFADRLIVPLTATVVMDRVMAVWATPARRTAFVRFGAPPPAGGGAVVFVGGSDAFSVVLERGTVIARLSQWEARVFVGTLTQVYVRAAFEANVLEAEVWNEAGQRVGGASVATELQSPLQTVSTMTVGPSFWGEVYDVQLYVGPDVIDWGLLAARSASGCPVPPNAPPQAPGTLAPSPPPVPAPPSPPSPPAPPSPAPRNLTPVYAVAGGVGFGALACLLWRVCARPRYIDDAPKGQSLTVKRPFRVRERDDVDGAEEEDVDDGRVRYGTLRL